MNQQKKNFLILKKGEILIKPQPGGRKPGGKIRKL